MANFRPLQPAPLDQEQPSQPQARPIITQKPKRTVTLGACVACRKRKSKCDGTRPVCSCCAQKDTECLYELGPNEKPSQALKRKHEEMQGELSNLRQLYDFLRLRPEPEALEIFRRIRTTQPETTLSERIQELAKFIRHGDLFVQPSFASFTRPQSNQIALPPLRAALESLDSESAMASSLPFPNNIFSAGIEIPSSQRRRHGSDVDVSGRSDSQGLLPHPVSIEAILQEPLSAVIHESTDPRLGSARHWTKVTDDTHVVIHLMSAWYKSENSYWHFLDWNILLDDMASTTGPHEFCSELLVNALLASASFQSSIVKDRSTPFSENLTTLFYEEARRLWEVEERKYTISRLQAAMLLFMVLGKHGRDKDGHPFLLEACHIAQELKLFRLPPTASGNKMPGLSEQKWEKARAVAAWSLFNFQLAMSLTYSFPVIQRTQPPLPIPYDEDQESEALFRSECHRNQIMIEYANTLVGPDDVNNEIPPKPEQVEILYLRLNSWWKTRHESLDPIRNPLPEYLLAAMNYHVLIIRLVQPFLNRKGSLERIKSYRSRAQPIATASMKELRRLLMLHEVRHGWACAIPYILHAIMVTSFGSLEEIALEDRSRLYIELSEPYQGLMTCLRALSCLCSFIYYAQPLFRLIAQTCQSLNIQLPIEALGTLELFRSEEWTKNALHRVSSQYIADMSKTTVDTEDSRMDAIVSAWDALTLGNKTGSTSRRSIADDANDVTEGQPKRPV
ncbi:hypothetical protein P154DRAFT_320031 [Amniculicola lignicola CBS 123094]|uniref:Zn(2)-C6 fungal-type domain-containing protein n=1 Tax=Amniculicola lignicola CBS 123094 TaxID=1392246 RepID=A0A6A5W5V9_9PLEO|nr:hypothetical protein P154DRAFT_320031 [Amniculicola lignicola CBS 123094]